MDIDYHINRVKCCSASCTIRQPEKVGRSFCTEHMIRDTRPEVWESSESSNTVSDKFHRNNIISSFPMTYAITYTLTSNNTRLTGQFP